LGLELFDLMNSIILVNLIKKLKKSMTIIKLGLLI
jgi:hypothetical protein